MDVRTLREVVKKLVPMIAGRGVRVTQQGAQAFVQHDPRTGKTVRVNIPHIADDANERMILAIQGFIDHEVGHVLDTTWGYIAEAEKIGRKIGRDQKIDGSVAAQRLKELSNIVEDPFVESCMRKRFPGADWNLDRLYDVFLERVTQPALDAAKDDGERFGVLIVPLVRAWAGQKRFDKFLTDGGHYSNPIMKAFIDRVQPSMLKELKSLKSSWDSLDVATQIYHILYPAPPIIPPAPAAAPPPPPPSGPTSGTSEDPGEGAGSSEKPEEEDDKGSEGEPEEAPSAPSAGGEEAEGEEDEEGPAIEEDDDEAAGEPEADDEAAEPPTEEAEAGGSGEEKDEKSEGEQEAAEDDASAGGAGGEEKSEEKDGGGEDDEKEAEKPAAGAGSDSGDEPEEAEAKPEGEAGGPPSAVGETPSGTPPSEEDGDGEPVGVDEREPSPFEEMNVTPKDMAEAIAELITADATRETRGADYRIFTKDFDVVESLEVPSHLPPYALERLDETTRHMVAPMQKEIERMMAARSQSVKIPGFRSGRLHSGSLHRLRVGDDRVFRRKQENISKETAVSLVVDNSGSMNGEKIQTAMAAAYALSQTLERVGIKHEVIGFTTKELTREQSRELNKEESRVGTDYSRSEPIYMPIYKSYDERLTPEVKRRFAATYVYGGFLRNNIDGESITMASHRLLQQREPRKVMLVLSDGHPSCNGNHSELYSDLHDAVDRITRARIEIVGIGIKSSAVRQFYPQSIVLDEIKDLPKTVMGELKRILLGGNTKKAA
jgi:cobalamin biosynthesis protein CobT